MIRLAIISTHPIQYNAPWFRLLATRKNVDIKVFYTWSQSEGGAKYDPGFGKTIEWDIPLLEGYNYEFVENVSVNPGTRTNKGIVNPRLISTILQFEPTALLVFGWNFDSHLKAIRYFHNKVPVLFRGDSTLLDPISGIKSVLRKWVLSWVFKHIDTALYVGEANKAYFVKHGVKTLQLLHVPHAIDNDRFTVSESVQQEALQKRLDLGIATNDTLLLFAGKLESKKDPFILLNAMKQLQQKNIQLLFVGNGILEASLKMAAAGINNIHFLDFQNQQAMPMVYSMADLVVLPSKGPGETWGLAINEAMAAGKAVLVSNACGCAKDLVQEGENGWIFEAGNAEAIFKTINKNASHKSLLNEMGQRSKALIHFYSFNTIVQKIEQHLSMTTNPTKH